MLMDCFSNHNHDHSHSSTDHDHTHNIGELHEHNAHQIKEEDTYRISYSAKHSNGFLDAKRRVSITFQKKPLPGLFEGANATGWIVFIGNLIHKITDGLVIGAGK